MKKCGVHSDNVSQVLSAEGSSGELTELSSKYSKFRNSREERQPTPGRKIGSTDCPFPSSPSCVAPAIVQNNQTTKFNAPPIRLSTIFLLLSRATFVFSSPSFLTLVYLFSARLHPRVFWCSSFTYRLSSSPLLHS